MTKLVYIATPITKGDTTENVANTDAAMLALMRAGFAPINPVLSCYAGAAQWVLDQGVAVYWPEPSAKAHGDFRSFTHADWLTMDKVIVSRCDAVLRLPGESTGADIETEHARSLGIPVFYSLTAMADYFREGCEVLTRHDMTDAGFAVVKGSAGNYYLHPCGLTVMISTKEEFDNHAREPWYWSFGEPHTRIPQRMCPTTVAGFRRLMATVREGEK